MYEHFIDAFIDDVILNKASAVSYFNEISQNPAYAWLVAMCTERLEQMESVDTSTPEYATAQAEALSTVSRDDYAAYNRAMRNFKLQWSKQNNTPSR